MGMKAKKRVVHSCRLCSLFRFDADIWFELHSKIFMEALPTTHVRKWVNTQILERNASLPQEKQMKVLSPNYKFYEHFKKHIKTMEDVHLVMKGDLFIEDQFNSPKTHLLPPDLELGDVSGGVEDYKRLRKLVMASERRLMVYEQKLRENEFPPEEGAMPTEIDLGEIQLFQKLIKELMGMQKELASLQVKQNVAGDALRESIEQIVNFTIATLQDTLIEMKVSLSRELPGSTLPDQMMSLVRTKMGDALKEIVPEVLESTYKRYKIK